MTATATPKHRSTPADGWTLPELGEFVKKTAQKTAEDIWHMGRALNFAADQCSHGEWEGWCREFVPFGRVTIWRYRQVADKLTLDQVRGQQIGKAYTLSGAGRPKPQPKPNGAPAADDTSVTALDADDTRDTGPNLEELADDIITGHARAVDLLKLVIAEFAEATGATPIDPAAAVYAILSAMNPAPTKKGRKRAA